MSVLASQRKIADVQFITTALNLQKDVQKWCLAQGHRRNVGWKCSVQTFMNEALSNVAKLTEELKNRKFKITHKYNFTTYERGKLRNIHSVHIRERVVQRCFGRR